MELNCCARNIHSFNNFWTVRHRGKVYAPFPCRSQCHEKRWSADRGCTSLLISHLHSDQQLRSAEGRGKPNHLWDPSAAWLVKQWTLSASKCKRLQQYFNRPHWSTLVLQGRNQSELWKINMKIKLASLSLVIHSILFVVRWCFKLISKTS